MSQSLGASRVVRGLFCSLVLLAIACGDYEHGNSEEIGKTTQGLTTAATHSLLIRHLSVVEDPERTVESCQAVASDADTKVWSLPYLLTKEAQRYNMTGYNYVANWLKAWSTSSTVNGQNVPVKGAGRVIDEWPKDGLGRYLVHKAPFRLTAIVFRPDLRTFRPDNEPMGGEVRFVFNATETTTCPKQASEQTIILEYSPGKTDENAVLDWAKRWYALGNLSAETSTYRSALQQLTDETIQFGRLERLRTNEVAIGETVTPGWFLNEFVPSTGGSLVRATVKQTPRDDLSPHGNTNLANFISANITNLETAMQVPQKGYMYNAGSGYHVTDAFSDGTRFRGAFANLSKVPSDKTYWNAPRPFEIHPLTWSDARHRFSLGTCNGCHGGEHAGSAFVFHVKPRDSGTQAALSDFLTGPTILTDPVDLTQRTYDEMTRRKDDLHWLANEMPLGNPVYGNYYKMRFQHSSKCMDLEGGGMASGRPVKQYTCNGNGNQRLAWIGGNMAIAGGNNDFSIRFKHSGRCLDVENGSTAAGARVVQNKCSSSSNSQKFTWFATSDTNSPLILIFKHSNKCLRVQNQSTSDGAQVIQDTCSFVGSRGLFLIE